MSIRLTERTTEGLGFDPYILKLTLNASLNDMQSDRTVMRVNLQIDRGTQLIWSLFGEREGLVAAQELVTQLKEAQLL